MEVITNHHQNKPEELTAERAIRHMLDVEEDHLEKVDDYLIDIHTSYLASESFTTSYRERCNFYFTQLRYLLKALRKIERQREAEEREEIITTPAA